MAASHTETDIPLRTRPIKQSIHKSPGMVLLHLLVIAEISMSKSTKANIFLSLQMNTEGVSGIRVCQDGSDIGLRLDSTDGEITQKLPERLGKLGEYSRTISPLLDPSDFLSPTDSEINMKAKVGIVLEPAVLLFGLNHYISNGWSWGIK